MTRASSCAPQAPTTSPLTSYLYPILDRSPLASGEHIAVAISGGSDSVALTLLLAAWCQPRAIRLSALTVDHGLRVDSAIEAREVASLMRAYGIAHYILTPALNASIRNVQERARIARYDAMTTWCNTHNAHALCVAHHFDDMCETAALNAHRGDYTSSHSGIAFVSVWNHTTIVRPLLGIRKTILKSWLRAHQIAWIEDPSNATPRYARNRLRQSSHAPHTLEEWLHVQHAGAQRHADDILRNTWCAHHAQGSPLGYITLNADAWRSALPNLGSEIIARAVREVGTKPHLPRQHETLRFCAQLRKNTTGKATLGGCVIEWNADTIIIVRELSRLPAPSPASSCIWDARFILSVSESLSAHTLLPIGVSGLSRLRKLQMIPPEWAAIPKAAIAALPCLLPHLDTAPVLPHIVDCDASAANCSGFVVRYAPPKPLAGAPFWWFNHAPYTNKE